MPSLKETPEEKARRIAGYVVTEYPDVPPTDSDNRTDDEKKEAENIIEREARKTGYPKMEDQLDMLYHDQLDGTTTFKAAIAKAKTDNPKPSGETWNEVTEEWEKD